MVADRSRMTQVITNLVDNAIRHSQPSTAVTLRAHRTDEAFVFDVLDEGPGIAPADRRAVFDRFTRGGSTDGGTGLGLSIARWATELHGGTIEVLDSEVGCHIRVAIPEH